MADKERIIVQLKAYRAQRAEHFGITKMGVFGSVARGSFKDGSDVDIVVELKKRNLLNRIALKQSLENYLGLRVDVVSYRENLSPLLKERIKRDVIYV